MTFLHGLAALASVLLVLGAHWRLLRMMGNSWKKSSRGFLWRLGVLSTPVLLLGAALTLSTLSGTRRSGCGTTVTACAAESDDFVDQ